MDYLDIVITSVEDCSKNHTLIKLLFLQWLHFSVFSRICYPLSICSPQQCKSFCVNYFQEVFSRENILFAHKLENMEEVLALSAHTVEVHEVMRSCMVVFNTSEKA